MLLWKKRAKKGAKMPNETIGKCVCPVCGEEMYARANKNLNIYARCPRSHCLHLNAFESKKAVPALHRGETVKIGNVTIYPEVDNERRSDNYSIQPDNFGRNDRRRESGEFESRSVANATQSSDDDDWI